MQKVTDVDYTKKGSPACQKKGDTCNMAGYKFIKGTLHDEDGTWIVRARVPDRKTGKIRQRSKTTGLKVKDNTKRKAERKMRDIVAAWEKEANADGCDESPLFSEYVQKFIEHKSLTIRENTICSYQFYADKHINPNIGDMQIKSMKRQNVQDFYNMLRKNGLSVNSIRKIGVVVAGAFHMAILDDVISVNVAKSGDIELPTAEHFEGKTYDEGQLLTLLEKLENEAEPIRCAITLAVCYVVAAAAFQNFCSGAGAGAEKITAADAELPSVLRCINRGEGEQKQDKQHCKQPSQRFHDTHGHQTFLCRNGGICSR